MNEELKTPAECTVKELIALLSEEIPAPGRIYKIVKIKQEIPIADLVNWFESKLPKEVEIKEGNVEHTEPLDTEWHKCPNCDNIVIATADNFCASCGSKIKWVAK